MNLNKKYCLPITTWNKKHSSKQAVPIAYKHLEKFFAAADFEGL